MEDAKVCEVFLWWVVPLVLDMDMLPVAFKVWESFSFIDSFYKIDAVQAADMSLWQLSEYCLK